MPFSVMKTPAAAAAAFVFILLCIFHVSAARVLTGERWRPVSDRMLRGPVPPSGRNPCSFIPGLGRGRCTLSEVEDEAGGGGGGSSAFPGMNFDGFAAGAMVNGTQKQDPSLRPWISWGNGIWSLCIVLLHTKFLLFLFYFVNYLFFCSIAWGSWCNWISQILTIVCSLNPKELSKEKKMNFFFVNFYLSRGLLNEFNIHSLCDFSISMHLLQHDHLLIYWWACGGSAHRRCVVGVRGRVRGWAHAGVYRGRGRGCVFNYFM